MAQSMTTAEQLKPTNPELQQATIKALDKRVSAEDVRAFLDKATGAGVPDPVGATITLNIAVWGKLDVEPDNLPWKYDNTVWGGPAYFGSGVGFMYTAYDSWDAFFQNVTACHVQGIDVGGGILQVNWFISDGTPVGQFNGAAGGVGLVEGGGSGGWTHK
jgi:hypothetical protein